MPKIHFLFAFIFSLIFCNSFSQEGIEILKQSIDKIDNLDALYFEMVSRERIEGDFKISQAEVKVQIKPEYKTYIKSKKLDGTKGPEVLYERNTNKATISPNQFPYFNIETDPSSWILRKGHHHTIESNAFQYLSKVIKNEMKKIGSTSLPDYIDQGEDVIFKHWNCHQINIKWKGFDWIPYLVKPGETISSIADRLHFCDYHALAKNTGFDDFDDPNAGDKILIPNHFAKEVNFFIDKVSKLPVFIKISDENLVFSEYQFNWLIVNPSFTTEDFSQENPKYNF